MMDRKRASKLLIDTAKLIDGEKAKAYGEPQHSFEMIAKFWTLYLKEMCGIAEGVTVANVGEMMILFKVARAMTGQFSVDNYKDICGYAALAGSDDKIG